MMRSLHGSIEAQYETEIDSEGKNRGKARDIHGEVLLDLMQQCNWIRTNGHLQVQNETHGSPISEEFCYPEPTPSWLKEWASLIKQQEKTVMARRRNASNVSEQVDIHENETLTLHLPPCQDGVTS